MKELVIEMKDYKNSPNTVDAIIERDHKILMIKRAKDPFKNCYALPGGFVDYGEKVEEAVKREVREEVGIKSEITGLLGVYSGSERDPRGPVISTVFILNFSGSPKAGDDAKSFHWINIDSLETLDLAFDHNKILKDYLKWKNTKEGYWSNK